MNFVVVYLKYIFTIKEISDILYIKVKELIYILANMNYLFDLIDS
jgi:hypothetical protein